MDAQFGGLQLPRKPEQRIKSQDLATAAELVAQLRTRHGPICAAIQQSLNTWGRPHLLERLRLSLANVVPMTDRHSAAVLASVLSCIELWSRR